MEKQLRNDVKERLFFLGYVVTPEDRWALHFSIDKVIAEVQSKCHVKRVPEKLHRVIVDVICGEFLIMKKGAAGDIEENLPGFDLDGAVKQIKAGDTTIDLGIGSGEATAEQRLDALIQSLLSGRRSFVSFRKLSW